MKEQLTICKGGKLINTYWCPKDEQYLEEDVTEQAISLLFNICELEKEVTLRDIFLLLDNELALFNHILGNWCSELVEDGFHPLSLAQKKKKLSEPLEEKIEYLELYWTFRHGREEGKTFILGYLRPDFHGVGVIQKKDRELADGILEAAKGERIFWGISGTPINELIDLPVKLNKRLEVITSECPEEVKTQSFDESEFSLGHILDGILWELSFWGSPKDRDKEVKKLKQLVEKRQKHESEKP